MNSSFCETGESMGTCVTIYTILIVQQNSYQHYIMTCKCFSNVCFNVYNLYKGALRGHSHDHYKIHPIHLTLVYTVILFFGMCLFCTHVRVRGLQDLHYNTWHGFDFTTVVHSKACTAPVLSDVIQPEVNWFEEIKGSPALVGLERSKSQD